MPYQGKSTIRDRLVDRHDFRSIPFARILKRMVKSFLVECGYTEESADQYINVDKYIRLERIPGVPTATFLMQTLGTDWGRNVVHTNLWTMEWESKARAFSRSGINVVADDLRFPNEVEVIKRLGGLVWRVERPGIEIDKSILGHAGEGRLNSVKFDRGINNAGTIGELHKKVDRAVSRFF